MTERRCEVIQDNPNANFGEETFVMCGALIVEGALTATERQLIKRNPETGIPKRYVCESGHPVAAEVV